MSDHSVVRKLIVLTFSFVVFVTLYAIADQSLTVTFLGLSMPFTLRREVLTFMGIMLMVTLVYLELLLMRDYFWIIEGASPEVRRWREHFFNRETLKRLKIRKMLVVVFSTGLFTWLYIRTRGTELYSFLGIILMITVLYFEVLAMRDELRTLCDAFKAKEIENSLRREMQIGVGKPVVESEKVSTPVALVPPETVAPAKVTVPEGIAFGETPVIGAAVAVPVISGIEETIVDRPLSKKDKRKQRHEQANRGSPAPAPEKKA
jgi:hypothetical protein